MDGIADDGRQHGDERHCPVAGAAAGKQPESKHPQQRAVCVGGNDVDSIKDALAVELLYQADKESQQGRQAEMHLVSFSTRGLFIVRVGAQEVDAHACCHCREGGVGIAEGGCNHADSEKYEYGLSELSLSGKHRQDVIARGRQVQMHVGSQCEQENTQAEKEEIQRDERKSVAVHVFLSLL